MIVLWMPSEKQDPVREFSGLCYLIPVGDCLPYSVRVFSMKILSSVVLLILFGLLPSLNPLRAAQSDLYSGAVPVTDQSPGEQSRAMPLSLAQVLGKLTGLRDFSGFPDLDEALQDARTMAITFYYRQKQVTLPDGNLGEELRLVVNFSRPAVDNLIQAMQLPIWKPERRPLTIWLVIDDGLSRRIMPIEFEYAWERLNSVADIRGMPVLWPQPDAEGNYPVDPQLLWGGYTEDLVESGPADALILAARREGPEWSVRMNLDYMDERLSWRIRATEIQDALVDGMNMAIDEIAQSNSIAVSDQGRSNFEITITGLAAADDYVRCLTYLQHLSLVDHVQVTRAGPGWARFILTLNAVPDYLLRSLATDGILAASENEGEYSLLP